MSRHVFRVTVLLVLLAVGGAAGPASAATDATAAFENRMTAAVQRMVDTVAGPGRAVVTTTAVLDLDQVERVTTTYTRDPSAGALSERLSRRSGGGYESTSAERTTALNSLRETRSNAPGRVKRLTVAVLVDAAAAEDIDLGELETLVSVAAGADPARGDVVTVMAMPFTERSPAAPTGAKPAPADGSSLLPAAGLAAVILALMLLAVRYRRHRVRTQAAAPAPRPALRADAVVGPPRITPERAAVVLRDWTGPQR